MSKFNELITSISAAPANERAQLLEFLMHNLERIPLGKLSEDDRQALLALAMEQVEALLTQIPATTDYRTKDQLFVCQDMVCGLVMYLCPKASSLPAGAKDKLQFLMALVQTARIMENTLEKLMDQESIDGEGAGKLLSLVDKIPDEYRRGRLWAGLIHFEDRIRRMTPEAKAAFTGFLTRELDRYLAMENPGRDELENLELMADVCGHLPGDQTQRQLHALLERKEAHIGYFAAVSLLKNDMILPQEAVEFLARDLGYALLTHALLKKHGQASRFPAECATEEYLAKSDLVHWLLYPTELGQAPDEIEYIGKFKPFLKKNAYHIFRFRSNSDTLSEDCKGKWLIGWSNCDSGTFSNFDLYDDYAKDTPEATVKNIRKKLIG